MPASGLRVAIVYSRPSADLPVRGSTGAAGGASESAVLGQVRLVADSLQQAGHECLLFSAFDAAELCAFLVRERPDVIFNCCESLRGESRLEMNVAALFELFELPYTGSPALTLGTALDKGLAKNLLRANGVATPPFAIVRNASDATAELPLTFPLIVKPLCEDASIGIDSAAVVDTQDALLRRIRFVIEELGQPALVEEFIDGREFGVSLLAAPGGGCHTLPISEIEYDEWPPGVPRILTYAAKWDEQSRDFRASVPRCPAAIDSRLGEQLGITAVAAARALGLCDYGRVDLRARADDGSVFVLEVNPNPDLNSNAGFMRAARASGRTNAETVQEILTRCLERTANAAHRAVPSTRYLSPMASTRPAPPSNAM